MRAEKGPIKLNSELLERNQLDDEGLRGAEQEEDKEEGEFELADIERNRAAERGRADEQVKVQEPLLEVAAGVYEKGLKLRPRH
jgi:hypothetical protein